MMRRSDQTFLDTQVLPDLRGLERYLAGAALAEVSEADGYRTMVCDLIERIEERVGAELARAYEGRSNGELAADMAHAIHDMTVDRNTRALLGEVGRRLAVAEVDVVLVAEG